MREKLQLYKEKISEFWKGRSTPQKSIMLGAIIGLLGLIIGASLFASNPKMVPLYNNLSVQEVGQIKGELDTRGVKYELGNAGTTVLVPEANVDGLLVDLAAQGIPDSGSIDYGFFSDNTSWGMTDNEFNVMKLDAMQTELSNLMTQIEGIENAKVMINMPEEQIFVGEQQQSASASIVVNVNPGYQLKEGQIQSLYHLVSKAIPNLPTDNIAIMDQNFKYFDPKKSSSFASGQSYEFQQNVKDDIQNDIQRRVQQMLGMMMGQDKVMVSVTADIDFTQENRTENLVKPTDEEENEGLPVSVERITETYTGNPDDVNAGGTVTPDGDVPGYQGTDIDGENGDYELMKETINNEFSRIQKNIVESPYKIRDLGIQVAVDQNKDTLQDGTVQQLSAEEQATLSESITSILGSIVSTSIDKEFGPVDPANKVSIVFQEFNGKPTFNPQTSPAIPVWAYVAGGVLFVVVASLVWALARRRKTEEVTEESVVKERTPVEIPAIDEPEETEESVRRKQLERMAKEKPEDFAKLLRTWIAED